MRKTLLSLAALLLIASPTLAADIPAGADTVGQRLRDSPRHGEWVDIDVPGQPTKLHAWVVYPERKEKAPVVIVIHEIFGLTDWVRGVADQLAADGFVAVAPDLLSGRGPDGGNTDSFEADAVRSAIQKLTPDEVTAGLNAARDYATKQPAATEKVATIGFCWGGSQSFSYATRQPELDAAVAYYGTGPKDAAALAKIPCPVAGFYGGDDARVTQTVEPTAAAMKEAGKTYEPHTYDGAGHGFLRQQTGRDANLKAAQRAWAETVSFLKKHLE
jgi:carboxymethylenebutenolidase